LEVYFANAPSQIFQEGILGEPKEEIVNLNGFEYMYLSNLKVPYFLFSSSVSIKVISMGTTLSRQANSRAAIIAAQSGDDKWCLGAIACAASIDVKV
jgi:hypothetical protein